MDIIKLPNVVGKFEDYALESSQNYCTDVTMINRNIFHHNFANLPILLDESHTYELMDYTIATLNASKTPSYLCSIYYYFSKLNTNEFASFNEFE